jgi:hypothetical protein
LATLAENKEMVKIRWSELHHNGLYLGLTTIQVKGGTTHHDPKSNFNPQNQNHQKTLLLVCPREVSSREMVKQGVALDRLSPA